MIPMPPGLQDLGRVPQAMILSEFDEVVPGMSTLFDDPASSPRLRRRRGVPIPQGDLQQYARLLARKRFGPGHWPELRELVMRESSWNPEADNPTSSAYGLFQFLDSTWENYGGLTHDPYKQVRKGLRYIRDRYGDPSAALDFHDDKGWY